MKRKIEWYGTLEDNTEAFESAVILFNENRTKGFSNIETLENIARYALNLRTLEKATV